MQDVPFSSIRVVATACPRGDGEHGRRGAEPDADLRRYVQTPSPPSPTMGVPLRTDHLPFPMPASPHALSQEWRNLTFMHWKVDPARLEPYIPAGLTLDLHEGQAYVGTIPFEMRKVRPRGWPWVPGVSNFPEFNVRTYVFRQDQMLQKVWLE